MKDKILVHICCGVDAVWALQKIKEEFPDSEIKGFFYDPNIHPEEEYELRWIETERICNALGIECIKGEYELGKWLEATKGYEHVPERGERCTICHDLRLKKTAQLAKKLGYNKITTVLMMSPKKDFDVLKEVGEKAAEKYGLEFVAIDFRKQGGVEKMNKLSKEFEIYHQNYCGCIYALFQQRKGLEYIPELVSFGKGRLPGSREELLFIKDIRTFAENEGISCTEQVFEFIGWKLISSTMKIRKEPVQHYVLPMSKSIKGILRGKVTKIEEKEDRFVLFLNKSNLQIWILKEPLKEIPLEEPRFFNHPIFIVGIDQKEKLSIGTKVEFTLKTEFDPDAKSQNLIIGNINAPEKIFFHSDTLSDGSFGYQPEEIKRKIKEEKEKILKGDLCLIITGAETLGKLGKLYFKENSQNTLYL
ncbi:MAG: epoxyqueuosine reductase QueH [Aquificae bacterium]|nr:epoxyqueuosine reductase QueH [Aquificota bacterium]